MKVLIGTPVHESKDYSVERWLKNVAALNYPANLLMVDNSPNSDYLAKLKAYCARAGIKKYELQHLELSTEQGKHERVARSRETIRQYLLAHDYDAWFAWECDILVPNDSLGRLVELMRDGNYMMVNPNKWDRQKPEDANTDFGCCLIRRDAVEKYGFILDFKDPKTPQTWESGEAWFKRRVLDGGGSYMDAFGVIKPIYHLDN